MNEFNQHSLRPRPIKDIMPGVDWAEKPLKKREWIVPHLLPANNVTLLSGAGGVGKSLLCLQLQIAAALGKNWMGYDLPGGISSMGFYCEDDEGELHARMHAICKHYRCEIADLGEMVHITSAVGQDNALVTGAYNSTKLKKTMLYTQIEQSIMAHDLRIVILDTLSDVFQANENSRQQVRYFLSSLQKLASLKKGSIILNAHPSRTGQSDGSGSSGSTAWEAGVRSRLYLSRPFCQDAAGNFIEDLSTDARILKCMKANYTTTRQNMRLTWRNGAFMRTDMACIPPKMTDITVIDQKVLEAIEHFASKGTYLAYANGTKASVTAKVRKCVNCKGLSYVDVDQSKERLIENNKVVLVEKGPKSKRRVYVWPVSLELPDGFNLHTSLPTGTTNSISNQ